MTEYHATVTREDDMWVIEIDGLGATQARSRDEVESMARDYVAIAREIPASEVEVTITWPEPVWDRMVDAGMEILRRDSGYPSVADMDREAPAWRAQCEEIVTAALSVALGAVESPTQDDGRRCPRCRPDNSCTLWCFEALIAENAPELVREVFALRRELAAAKEELDANRTAYYKLIGDRDESLEAAVGNAIMANIDAGMPHVATAAIMAMFAYYETPYVDERHQGSNLLELYLELAAEFTLLNARRCSRYTCDHLETIHGNIGCDRCSCPELTRTPTK